MAEKTNQSKRTVQNEIKVAKDVIPELKEQLKDKNIGFAKAVEISRLEPLEQQKLSEKLKSNDTNCLSLDITKPEKTIHIDSIKSSNTKKPFQELVSIFESVKPKIFEVYPKLSADEKSNLKGAIESILRALD